MVGALTREGRSAEARARFVAATIHRWNLRASLPSWHRCEKSKQEANPESQGQQERYQKVWCTRAKQGGEAQSATCASVGVRAQGSPPPPLLTVRAHAHMHTRTHAHAHAHAHTHACTCMHARACTCIHAHASACKRIKHPHTSMHAPRTQTQTHRHTHTQRHTHT